MNQRQQNVRYAAARAFIESLDQLQETLQSSETPPETLPDPEQTCIETSPDQFDLNSLEQAVADIEAFMQQRQQDGNSAR